jgi:hypothetical protein
LSVSKGALAFDLGGVGIRVRGLPGALESRLEREWSGFLAEAAASPFLDVEVVRAAMPAPGGPFAPKAMRSRLGRGEAAFGMQEGDVEVRSSGDAMVRLSTEVDGDRAWFAFQNLLRAALAWRLPSRVGMLLHAAGVVLDDRAFVLAGSEGSGKSTFASLAQLGGARVLSDDLVMLDGAGPAVDAVGAPFRSTHRGPQEAGRWRVAALLLPVHGPGARLDAVPKLLVRSRITANLPFVAEGIGADPRIDAVIDRLADGVPARSLVFARDPSFVEVLRGFSP